MDRMQSIVLAALVGSGALAGTRAEAQERGSERYSVADNLPRDRDQESRARIPRGTDIAVTLDEEIPIDRDRFGDTFAAHVDRDVVVKGDVVIPAGAPAKVKLVESSEKANAATVRLAELRVNGKMRDVAVSDARAAAGAIVGAVIGAGGGLAWGLLSDGGRAIEDDTTLRFELEEELKVR